MSKVTLYLIAGRTGSGKSTIASEVCKTYGFAQIKSYTTRPMRENEKIHADHVFIQPEDVKKFIDDIAAYTKIGDYEYFTTWEMLKNSDKHVYTIDPIGIQYLRSTVEEKELDNLFNFQVIYVKTDSDIRAKRLKERGDSSDVIACRQAAEEEQFSSFESDIENNLEPDVLVVDNTRSLEESIRYIKDHLVA